MPKKKMKKTSNASRILFKRYFKGRPKKIALIEQELQNSRIAQAIYDMRTAAELTQRELAELVGTTHSAISRLEDSDYDGHSLSMLRKIAEVFRARVQIHIVPQEKSQKYLKTPQGKNTEYEEMVL